MTANLTSNAIAAGRIENAQQLEEAFPGLLRKASLESHGQAPEGPVSHGALLAIPAQMCAENVDLFVMAGLWASSVGDDSACVAAVHNLAPVARREYGHGTNLTATATIWRREAPGPVAVLVKTDAAELETAWAVHTHPSP